MPRSIIRSVILLAPLLGVATFVAACGSTPVEEQLLRTFFRAARVRDNSTLANIAAVTYNPNTQGVVESFTIAEIGPEQRRTIDLRSLAEAETRAREEEAAFNKKRQEFQAANRDAVERVSRAQTARQQLRGRDAEFEAALVKWRDDHAEYQRRLSDARSRLNNDRSQVVGSLTPAGQPDVDVSSFSDVEVITKQVAVDAQVRTPEGQTEPRRMVFTLQRASAKDGDRVREGRWIIMALEQDNRPTS